MCFSTLPVVCLYVSRLPEVCASRLPVGVSVCVKIACCVCIQTASVCLQIASCVCLKIAPDVCVSRLPVGVYPDCLWCVCVQVPRECVYPTLPVVCVSSDCPCVSPYSCNVRVCLQIACGVCVPPDRLWVCASLDWLWVYVSPDCLWLYVSPDCLWLFVSPDCLWVYVCLQIVCGCMYLQIVCG